MHPDHTALLAELRRLGHYTPATRLQNDSYGGSGRPYYIVSVPDRRTMIRGWLAAHKAEPPEAALAVIESLLEGESHEERTLAGLFVGAHPRARATVRPADLNRWLGSLNGWAEIDTLCQNLFTADQMLADWPAWHDLIERLSRDPNINKRRAAMVLLNGPVHRSDDPRFAALAFEVIERLKGERDILITKAVSWLLRSMVTRHADAVARYLEAEAATLPAIAVRETRTKLATGTKSGRSRAKAE